MQTFRLVFVVGCAACATATPVPGHEGCTFGVATTEHGTCASTSAAVRVMDTFLAKRWLNRSSEEVKDHPSYSSLDPLVTGNADGSEIWRFNGADNCLRDETSAGRTTRTMHEAAQQSAEAHAEACAKAAALDPTIRCQRVDAPPPPPTYSARVCEDPEWTTDFAFRTGRVVSVKYLRLKDDKRF